MVVYLKETGMWSSKPATYRVDKLIDVINYLLIENFPDSVKDILKTQRRNTVFNYCKIIFDQNDYSHLVKMREELHDESDFIKNWMLAAYSNKIKNIIESRTFKIASKASVIFMCLKS